MNAHVHPLFADNLNNFAALAAMTSAAEAVPPLIAGAVCRSAVPAPSLDGRRAVEALFTDYASSSHCAATAPKPFDFDPHDTPEADYLRRMAAACCHDEAEGAVQCDCGRWLCLDHQVMTAGGAMCAGCLSEWAQEEAALAAALEVAA